MIIPPVYVLRTPCECFPFACSLLLLLSSIHSVKGGFLVVVFPLLPPKIQRQQHQREEGLIQHRGKEGEGKRENGIRPGSRALLLFDNQNFLHQACRSRIDRCHNGTLQRSVLSNNKRASAAWSSKNPRKWSAGSRNILYFSMTMSTNMNNLV